MVDIANPDFLCVVVGPGLVSTSPAFMRSIASHPAGPHGRLAKNGNRAPMAGGVNTICTGFFRPLQGSKYFEKFDLHSLLIKSSASKCDMGEQI